MAHAHRDKKHFSPALSWRAACAAGLLILSGCDGDDGRQGPPGPPGPPADGSGISKTLEPRDDAPGVVVAIVGLGGASGADGNFAVGDQIRVQYTIARDDGSAWNLSDLDTGRILVSGPTFNYQRVIAEQTNLLTASTPNADGSFTYVFAQPIPATYIAPYNDTTAFGLDDGELQGQDLLAGTYTVGLYATWNYTVGSASYRDQGETVAHFLFGQTSTIQPRAVVGQENCNACHSELQAHGGLRRNIDLCVLCHTAGAEDRNTPDVAGGTPGVSIAMDVMIHRIHSGGSLPSVLGVTTNADGTRNYDATPQPYQLIGFGNSLHDYSDVAFPQWPNLSFPLPRDAGFAALSPQNQATENRIRRGAANCAACHGDPDGDGPLEAPAQGDLAYTQPSRNSCGSCHDDVIWELPYQANMQIMPPQLTDSACTLCHAASGNHLAVIDAHRHPMLDPAFNPGLHFEILGLSGAGPGAGAAIGPGSKLELSVTIQDDSGAAVSPAALAGISTTISGPTSNYNLIHFINLPTAFLSGSQPFVFKLPETIWFEVLGNATAGADEFTTSRAPHYTTGFSTTVFSAGLAGESTTLVTSTTSRTNFLDVADATGFSRNDSIVIDRGVPGLEEYLRIQYVEENVHGSTDRLWFGSPAQTDYPLGPRVPHMAGATVERLLPPTQLMNGNQYTLDAATGTITETGGFTDGEALFVTYTTDFLLPEVYELALNDSPDLGNEVGKWSGLPLLDGTYTFMIWGNRTLSYSEYGETTAYRNTAKAAKHDFLVGSGGTIEPYAAIVSADTCYACHQDIYFHGGQRRGFDSCISCHTMAGSEDRPQYRAAGAPATTGVTIDFVSMLHKIHHGANLTNAASYEVVGFGGGPYPNNFTAHAYDHVHFPSLPSGTKNCAACHGATNDAWKQPGESIHPDQDAPTRNWTIACSSCHDSNAALAHMEIMTAPISGLESCALCHGPGKELDVPTVHKVR